MALVTAQNFSATLIECRSKLMADGRERMTLILNDSYRIYFEGMRKLRDSEFIVNGAITRVGNTPTMNSTEIDFVP